LPTWRHHQERDEAHETTKEGKGKEGTKEVVGGGLPTWRHHSERDEGHETTKEEKGKEGMKEVGEVTWKGMKLMKPPKKKGKNGQRKKASSSGKE